MLDDLFTYRLAERCFLTVTNAANHERDLAWFQRHAAGFDADVIDRRDEFAMLAVQGPRRGRSCRRSPTAPLPSRMHCGERTIAGVPMLVCGTGYTGEPGVELLLDPDGAAEVWDAAGGRRGDAGRAGRARHPAPGGRLPPLRQRPDRDHGPIEAGLGWCCREATGFIGSDAVARVRAEGPAEKLVAFEMTGPGIARQGNPVAGGGVVTSGTFSPCLERGIGMAYVPRRARRARHRARDRRPGHAARRGRRRAQTPLHQEERASGRSQLSGGPPLPRRARLGADRRRQATFGITWYAQDSLGEVVFFDPPEVGTTVTKDASYTEIESVKAVSDVDLAAVGRDHRGQRRARRHARDDQRGSLRRRAGWSRSSCLIPASRRHCWTPRPTQATLIREPVHRSDGVRPRRDAARRSASSRSRSCSPTSRPTCGSTARSRSTPASPSSRSFRSCGRWPRATPAPRTSSASWAPACMTTTSRRWSTRSSRARSSSPRTRPTSPRSPRAACRRCSSTRPRSASSPACRSPTRRCTRGRARWPPPATSPSSPTPAARGSSSPAACTRTRARRWPRWPTAGGWRWSTRRCTTASPSCRRWTST